MFEWIALFSAVALWGIVSLEVILWPINREWMWIHSLTTHL